MDTRRVQRLSVVTDSRTDDVYQNVDKLYSYLQLLSLT